MIGPRKLGDEQGTTLIELMVGLMAGMAILAALGTVLISTLHGSVRVSARVEATQRARVVLTQITEELHSSCVAPQIAPVQGSSTGTSLSFLHATGSERSAVAPKPTKSVISLQGGVLTRTDYASTGGVSPNWTFASTGTAKQLLTKVRPIPPSSAIFTYYRYVNGALVAIPATTAIGEAAKQAIQVQVAFNVDPEKSRIVDSGADTSIQSSAPLRLTPPSMNESATSLPCQ